VCTSHTPATGGPDEAFMVRSITNTTSHATIDDRQKNFMNRTKTKNKQHQACGST